MEKTNHSEKDTASASAPIIRVLLVDDDVALLKLEQLQLEQAGFQVVTARNGTEALEKVRTEKPEVALIDVMMPKMNGWEVCHEIKAHPETAAIPVFFLTALGEEEDIFRHHKSSADGYFIKPFNIKILAKTLKETVEKSQS